MSSDGGPSAKRPKFDQDDDELHPGIQERRASIASTGGDKSISRSGESFPQQLMKMLNDPANSEIVAWVPSGDAFMVHSKDQFVTEVMPAYFGKQSKFTSFTRKLNRWGFTRDSQDQNKGAYSHPLFHRDDPTSHEKMSCVSQAGQGAVRGGGKAKRRNSGPMAMSKANARVPAGEATAVAGDAGVGAGLAGAMGVGLITPQIAHEQLTSQMMFGSQGLSDSAGGFAGLSPFGFTPMAMTPGTLSIAGLTPGGVTGLTPGTLTPGLLSGLSPMMQIKADATAEQQGLGAGFGNGAVGGALPPPPPLAGPTATPSSAPNIDVMEFIGSNGESQEQEQRATEGQPPQQQQMRNHASSQNPFLNNTGMPFSGGLMGSFASAQHFLQMQQQRVQQQLQAQQMQLLQLKQQQAALANSSNNGSLEGPGTAVPPISAEGEGMGVGSGAVSTGGGDDELGDLNTGGLGGTGFSPAPPGDDNVPPVRPASGNDLMQMQLIQQMQAQIHHQQQILNGTSLQLRANRLAGLGGGVLPVGAEPDPLPTGVDPQVPMGSMMNGTISGPGQFQLQQQEAGGVGVGANQGEAPLPATPSDPAEEQSNIPNITDSDTTKEAIAELQVAVGATPTPVADAQ
eukprot:CAMPEP_0185799364 /NCGR_PEP_ID=MMETSP1322-20130828/283_1 /TAXON_ID=265543 /ORGANISM="Minutocellus polymorphus, Strain RCC2270" /LENGTH=624 /DNA_ID=CAMNT_0028494935 /DNA_START=87 /DNA_END=1961 /DNA_ORIENTATION=-